MRIQIITSILITFLLILGNINEGTAQEEQSAREIRYEKARGMVKELKEGILIVRLPSEQKKIQELERLAALEESSNNMKKQYKKSIKTIIKDRDESNKALVAAFSSVYDFSEVLFFYDTASVAIKEGRQTGFVNSSLKEDPTINLNNKAFYVLRQGGLDASTSTGLDAIVVMDNQFVDLQRPFPYYVRIRGFMQVFKKIFSPGKGSERTAIELVERLNEQLWVFYEGG